MILSQIQARIANVRNILICTINLTSIAPSSLILLALSIESSTLIPFWDRNNSTWYILGVLCWLGGVTGRSRAGVAGGKPQNFAELHNSQTIQSCWSTLSHLAPLLLRNIRLNPKVGCPTLHENWERTDLTIDNPIICRFTGNFWISNHADFLIDNSVHGFVVRQAFVKFGVVIHHLMPLKCSYIPAPKRKTPS